jgi:thiamine-phosphate diphosphorylase
MAIAGDAAADGGIAALARAAAAARSAALMIRLRDPARALAASRVARTIFGGRLIVSARADVASLSGADGVHLPESGVRVGDVRRAFPALAIGVSRHDRDGLRRAEDEGADYALLGPVFSTPEKENRALGLERFSIIVAGLSLPVWAVGGVDASNAAACVAAGASGVAAIRPFAVPRKADGAFEALGRALGGQAER